MSKFHVHVRQWVEEIAEVEVEAETPEQAAELAVALDLDMEWRDGSAISRAEARLVVDADGVVVWEDAKP